MAKPELGTKRVCPTTGRKFYDLNKDPIISPYTGMVVPVAAVTSARGTRAEAKAAPEAVAEEAADEAEVEVVSLEDADEEATSTGKKGTAPDADDVDVDEDIPDSDDDDTFLEEDEDENVDAAELIGDVEDDEET